MLPRHSIEERAYCLIECFRLVDVGRVTRAFEDDLLGIGDFCRHVVGSGEELHILRAREYQRWRRDQRQRLDDTSIGLPKNSTRRMSEALRASVMRDDDLCAATHRREALALQRRGHR